jgi:alpha-L-rhamnosidase
MRTHLLTPVCLLLSVAGVASPAFGEKLSVKNLRTEYMTNPLGLGTDHPRLSWTLDSTERGQLQRAYQILVATTPEALAADKGDLWDSGQLKSSRTVHVVYAGKPLTSGQRAYWKVRAWGKDDQPTGWSEPAWWELGLLNAADWKGQWIGADAPRVAPTVLTDAFWVWRDEGDPKVTVSGGERFFRCTFELPPGQLADATLAITADDEFTAYVNGKPAGDGRFPVVSELKIADSLRPGRNVIAVKANNLGGSAGVIAKLTLHSAGGERTLVSDASWKAAEKSAPGWETPEFNDKAWQAAKQVARFGELPWRDLTQPAEVKPAPHLRKGFELTKEVASARAYVSGLGYYELYLNGLKVGDHVLDPAFTRYDRRVLYATYDVTTAVRHGKNAVGAILGNGWYNFHPKAVWNFDKAPWRDAPCLRCQLDIAYTDGTHDTIVSDDTWKAAAGPIVFDGLMMGETYDARRELPGWAAADFDDSAWTVAHAVKGPAGRVVAQAMPPIKVLETIQPARIAEPKPGVFVYDMGQAFAGWARLNVSGPAGAKITLKYGEVLNPDGTVNQDQIKAHIREPRFQTDEYILKGEGAETWEPRFNYNGFQYVEVTSTPAGPTPALTLDSLRGRVVHTAFEPAGKFECSNELLNRIQHATLRSYGANFHGYPTDCPHREKNGWTGDAQLAAEQAMYNWNNIPAYEKWMNDLADEQRPSGELPGIVPTAGWGYNWGNGPAWDSAYVLIPWYMYQYYGDTRVLQEQYAGMKRYVDYMKSRAKDGIVDFGLGDWVHLEEDTPVALTSTGYYYTDASIVAKTALIKAYGSAEEIDAGIARTEDMKPLGDSRKENREYETLADQSKASFNTKFAPGKYAGTQAGLGCALYQGLAPEDKRKEILDALVADVEKQKKHLNVGILGAKYLLHALTDGGRADLAYDIVNQKTYPGWGHWMEQGATTLWEDWKGESSRLHIMFGDVSAWFYQCLAGINADQSAPGFEHIIIHPHLVGDLAWAKGEYHSIRGRIVSSWTREDDTLRLTVVIPANCTATVYVPAASVEAVTESGHPARDASGLKFVEAKDGYCVFAAVSGQYEFQVSGAEK